MFLFPLEALVRHQKLFELFMIFPSTSSQFRYDKINNIFWRIHGLYAKKGDEIWNWNDNNLSILSERFQILNIYLAVFILKGGFSHFKGLMGIDWFPQDFKTFFDIVVWLVSTQNPITKMSSYQLSGRCFFVKPCFRGNLMLFEQELYFRYKSINIRRSNRKKNTCHSLEISCSLNWYENENSGQR